MHKFMVKHLTVHHYEIFILLQLDHKPYNINELIIVV